MSWFYIDESITDGDRRKGPYSLDEIRSFVESGIIKDSTLVWKSGDADWVMWKDSQEAKNLQEREELLQSTIDMLLKQQIKTKQFAGFFVRVVAYILDNLILSVFGVAILFIMGSAQIVDFTQLQDLATAYIDNPTSTETLNNLMNAPGMSLFLILWSIIQSLYFIIFNGKFSATPGKMLLHIHIETANGEKISWGTSIARYLASIFTQLTMVVYGLGYLIVCIDPKRRALHDWVAKTFVVYGEKEK